MPSNSPSRRSARLKGQPAPPPPSPPLAAPPKKRAKRRHIRSSEDVEQGGILRNMPLDIIYEIISHLHPRELLSLARASRATRALLLSNSYAPIWRQSLQRLPYVERAPEGYLVEFADMMFGERCYFCNTRRVKPRNRITHLWHLKLRCCTNCLRKQRLFTRIHAGKQTPVLQIAEVKDALPKGMIGDEWYMLADDLKRYNTEYLSVIDRPDAFQIWKLELRISQKERENFTLLGDISLLRKAKLRQERINGIFDLLDESDLEEYVCDDVYGHPLLEGIEDLCEDDLAAVHATMADFCERMQTERFENRRMWSLARQYEPVQEYWDKAIAHMPPNDVYPPVCDVIALLPYKDFERELPIIRGLWVMHIKYACSPTLGFHHIVEQWRTAKDKELVAMMSEALGRTTTANDLHLATTFFTCTNPDGKQSGIGYPRILVTPGTHSAHDLHDSIERNDMVRILQETPWNRNGERVSFDHLNHDAAWKVVSLAGLDPDKATAAEMDALGAWFTCAACSTPGNARIMQWQQAILHSRPINDDAYELCKSSSGPALRVLDENDWPKAEAARDAQWRIPGEPIPDPDSDVREGLREDDDDNWVLVRCVHCSSNVYSDQLSEHMQLEHGITRVRPRDVVLPLDEIDRGEYFM